MKFRILTVLLAICLSLGCKSSKYSELGDGIYADIKTTQGDILLELYYQQTPVTVANFVSLAEGTNPFVSEEYKGEKFYDGVIFHRVMKDFMIQGGDPLGSGMGSPGYKFKDEFVDTLKHDRKGILSMANPGPNANGSQFFITHKETPWLDNRHTVFGEVVSGIETVDSIANIPVAEANRPVTDVVMNEVTIIRKGGEAKKFDAVQVLSDYFEEEREKEAALAAKKEAFAMELARQKEQATEMPSGLLVLTLKEGDGGKPVNGQSVLVNYAGWLADGTLFDTSIESVAADFGRLEEIRSLHRGVFAPSKMVYSPEARLIAGFKEGLLSMEVGDKVRLFIPPHLGYGPQGSGPIPPNADLVFDLEMLKIAE